MTPLFRILITLVAAPSFLTGCGEPQNPATINFDTDTDGNITSPGGTGSGGPFEYNGCLPFPVDNQFGYIHRCEADLSAHFSADVQGGAQEFDFDMYVGDPSPILPDDPDDNFENPKVMACCGEPLDLDMNDPDYLEDWANSDHYRACFHDFIEQGCRSLVFRMREAADELGVVAQSKLNNLADWIAANQQECFDTFWPTVEAWNYSFPAEEWLELTGTWQLPDGTVGNGWNGLTNIEISLDSSPPNRIYSAALPENQADWVQCESQLDNNDNSFLIADDPIDEFILSSGSVDLEGPPLVPQGEPVTGSASFKALNTNCDLCSTLSHADTPGTNDKVVDYLLLDIEQAEVGTSTQTLNLDRARIMLYEPEAAVKTGPQKWTIQKGKATFLLSGIAEGDAGIVSATNDTRIDLKFSFFLGWRILPFDITYQDASGQTWTVSVGTLDWGF